MKTLIAYATRYGSTARTAALLGEILGASGMEVAVVDARKAGRGLLREYDAFVVGSSIAAGRWKGSARRLLGRLAAVGKPVAVFVTAGGVMSGREPGQSPDAVPTSSVDEREAKAIERYLEPVAGAAGLTPVAKAAFGGRMEMFGKEKFNNWDGERIRAWGRALDLALRKS